MPLYGVESINIRSINIGEADKIITLFAKKHGKIHAVAKGSRRPTSKFGGRLEVFTHNQMLLATGQNLDIISQCETIDSFYRLREDRDKLNAGFYVIKLIDLMTEDRQPNDELFSLLLDALNALQATSRADIVSRSFEVRLCEVEGFLPSPVMLEKISGKLPAITEKLRSPVPVSDVSDKDLELSGRYFRELISDHTGRDIRRLKAAI